MNTKDFEVSCDLSCNQKVAECTLFQPFTENFKCKFNKEKNSFECDLHIKEHNTKVETLLNSTQHNVNSLSSFMSFFS